MPSPITIKKHHVVDKDLEAIIETFFSDRPWKGVYLSGGTCIAEFYFGHRISIDIDLFTQDKDLFLAATKFFSQKDIFSFGKLESTRSFPDFSEFLLKRGKKDPIKIDIVLDIPQNLGKKIQYGDIWLDSLPDLVSNKLGCIIHRNEVKDYLDLFYLLPAIDLPVQELIELGQKKDAGLDPIVLAHQLQFIQSIPKAPKILIANIPWKQIQGFFSHLHDEILDTLIK